MRKLLLLLATAAMAMLVVAPAAIAQSPAEGDLYDCGDFTTQEEAQAQLLRKLRLRLRLKRYSPTQVARHFCCPLPGCYWLPALSD